MFGRLKLRNWTGCIAEVEQHFSLILIHNVCRGWKSWRWICVLLVTSFQCLTWQDYAVPGKNMLYLASSCCFLVFLYFRTICLQPYTNKLKQLKRYSSYSPQSILIDNERPNGYWLWPGPFMEDHNCHYSGVVELENWICDAIITYSTAINAAEHNLTSDTEAPVLDLHLSISNGFISSKIYDKRDDFDFDGNGSFRPLYPSPWVVSPWVVSPPSRFALHYVSRFALLPWVVSLTIWWVVSPTFWIYIILRLLW